MMFENWQEVRLEREIFFNMTDWIMLSDVYAGLTPEQASEATAYRQALRDITSGTLQEASENWPLCPDFMLGHGVSS